MITLPLGQFIGLLSNKDSNRCCSPLQSLAERSDQCVSSLMTLSGLLVEASHGVLLLIPTMLWNPEPGWPDLENFRLMGGCFRWKFFENYKSIPNVWATFSQSKSYALTLTKDVLRNFLGDFFSNSTCHPVQNKNSFRLNLQETKILFPGRMWDGH
jgi:hypothetical protein